MAQNLDLPDDDESGDWYARCPGEDCDFMEEDIPERLARHYQNSGCPACLANRGIAVSTMDNL
jgi:hypothetical protein